MEQGKSKLASINPDLRDVEVPLNTKNRFSTRKGGDKKEGGGVFLKKLEIGERFPSINLNLKLKKLGGGEIKFEKKRSGGEAEKLKE